MRPSRRFLLLGLGALIFALLAVVTPFLQVGWALLPIAALIIFFVVDWFISPKPRSFELRIDCDPEVFINENLTVHLTATSKHKNGAFPPKLTGILSLNEGFEDPGEFHFQNAKADIALRAQRRGVWTIERCWLLWGSRMGLIDFAPVQVLNTTINVAPNIRMITSGEIDLEIQSNIYGGKQTSFRGEGSEFHQLNEYVQGMDPRSIDWKHSARQRSLVAKEMRAERNHQIIMAVDNGHLMREEIKGLPKLDHCINAALATAWAGLQGGDRVGLFAFDARPRLYLPPQPGRNTFSHMRSQMAQLQYKSIETNHTLALSSLAQRLSKRSLIIVFSDFADPLSAQLLVEHMAILNRRHVVIYVSLRDPLLSEMSNMRVDTMTELARSVSASNMLTERRSVLEALSAMGIFVIETDPGELTVRLLNTYLTIISQELI